MTVQSVCASCGFDKEGIICNSLETILKHSRECMSDD